MNILYKNLLDTYETEYSESDEIFPIENIKTRRVFEIGKFTGNEGEIKIKNIKEDDIPNALAVFNTDAKYLTIYSYEKGDNDDEIFTEENLLKMIEVKGNKCLITFQTNKKNIVVRLSKEEGAITVGLLMLGKMFTLPPRDVSEEEKQVFSRTQYVSATRQYFSRYSPVRKHYERSFSFNLLDDEGKERIETFFDENDFEPFVFFRFEDENIYPEGIYSLAIYGVSRYGDENAALSFPDTRENKKIETKNEVGLYVCMDEEIVFKTGTSKIFPYSTSLTFMEVY